MLWMVGEIRWQLHQEEGADPNNRLSKFASLLRDKGGLFSEALLEAKEGTLLAPSNEVRSEFRELLSASIADALQFVNMVCLPQIAEQNAHEICLTHSRHPTICKHGLFTANR